MELLDDLTQRLASATLSLGTSCAASARLVEVALRGRATVEDAENVEQLVAKTQRALRALADRHQALLDHVQMLLRENAAGVADEIATVPVLH